MIPRRANAGDAGWVLALIQRVFAEHDGRVDPPSSMHRLTKEDVIRQAQEGEIWVLGTEACVFLTPQPDTLYIGKLAVAPEARGKGYAGVLIDHAERRARSLNLEKLTLQTRVELIENHAIFLALGFAKAGETAHPGFVRPTSFRFEKLLKCLP